MNENLEYLKTFARFPFALQRFRKHRLTLDMARFVTAPLIGARHDLTSCNDLNGKPVALASTTGVTPSLFNLYLEQNCPASKPQIIVMANTQTRAAALLSGRVDAAQVDAEDIVHLEQVAPGQFHILVALGQEFPQVQSSGIHVRLEWAKQIPDLVKDFIRALLGANRQVTEYPSVLFNESVSRLGIDPVVAKEAGTMYLRYHAWYPNGGLTRENISYTLSFLAKIDPALAGLGVQDVADLSYLNTVLDEMGRK